MSQCHDWWTTHKPTHTRNFAKNWFRWSVSVSVCFCGEWPPQSDCHYSLISPNKFRCMCLCVIIMLPTDHHQSDQITIRAVRQRVRERDRQKENKEGSCKESRFEHIMRVNNSWLLTFIRLPLQTSIRILYKSVNIFIQSYTIKKLNFASINCCVVAVVVLLCSI